MQLLRKKIKKHTELNNLILKVRSSNKAINYRTLGKFRTKTVQKFAL